MPHSPFTHARAASGVSAWARTDLAHEIATAAQLPQTICVVGRARAGKSTLVGMAANDPLIVDCAQAFTLSALAMLIVRAAERRGGDAAEAVRAQAGAAAADPLADLIAGGSSPATGAIFDALSSLPEPPQLVLEDAGQIAAWDADELAQLRSALDSYSAARIVTASDRTQLDAFAPAQVWDLDDAAYEVSEAVVAAGLVTAASEQQIGLDSLAAQGIARLGRCDLASCQLLAERAWRLALDAQAQVIDVQHVKQAFATLTSDEHASFAQPFWMLAAGSAQEQRLARVMCLVADNAGARLRSDDLATRYRIGASGRMAIQRDLKRLEATGLASSRGSAWQLTDPLLQAWLRSRSPYGQS